MSAPDTNRPDARWPFNGLRGCEPFRSFEAVQCYRVEGYRGKGTERDPGRVVTAWFTAEGEPIAYFDPCAAPDA